MDTFVKVSVVKGGKVVKNKQTSVVRRNANPSYNEAFTIDLRCEDEKVKTVLSLNVFKRLDFVIEQNKAHTGVPKQDI